MARGRFLSKVLSTSERIGTLSDRAFRVWAMSLPHADREGRLPRSARELAYTCFPALLIGYSWTFSDIEEAIAELVRVGLWIPGSNSHGLEFFTVDKFDQHQEGIRKDREVASKWDDGDFRNPPESSGILRSPPASTRESSANDDHVRGRPPAQGKVSLREVEVEGEVQGQSPPLGISGARRQEAGMIVNDVVRDFQAAHPNGVGAVVGRFDRDAIIDAAHVLSQMPSPRRVEVFRRSLATLPPGKQTLQDAIRAMNNPEVMGNGPKAPPPPQMPHDRGEPCLCPKCCAEREAKELANAK